MQINPYVEPGESSESGSEEAVQIIRGSLRPVAAPALKLGQTPKGTMVKRADVLAGDSVPAIVRCNNCGEPISTVDWERGLCKDCLSTQTSIPSETRDPLLPTQDERYEETEEPMSGVAAAASRRQAFQPIIVTKAMHTRAESVRRLHECMGHPSARRLMEPISGGKIIDCPLTSIDICRADEIFGRCKACEAAKIISSTV